MSSTTDRRESPRRNPLSTLAVTFLILGIGLGLLGAAGAVAYEHGLRSAATAWLAVLGLLCSAWYVRISRKYDEEMTELQALILREYPECAAPLKAKRRNPRDILNAINPVNAYRVPMPSDEQMGLTAEADRQFRGPAEEELAREIRMACAKATARATEIQRMLESHSVERMYANSATAQSRADRHEADAKWLAFAYNRLAAGSTSAEQVQADWERRKASR